MYLSTLALFVLSRLTVVHAQEPTAGFDVLSSPPLQSSYAVGSVLPIVWAPESSTGTVTIQLNGGASPGTLLPVLTIAKGISSQAGSYNWTITSGIGSFASYGLNLTHDGGPEFQYSYAFHLTGGSGVSTSSSSSSSDTSSTSTSASGTSTSVSVVTTSSTSRTASDTAVISTPSATGSGTTTSASVSTVTSATTIPANGTVSKTSSVRSSGTSSAISSGPTSGAVGAPVQFLSGSLTVIGACLFAFVL